METLVETAATQPRAPRKQIANDVHSRLNATEVACIERPRSTRDVVDLVGSCIERGERLSVAGGRHAMGGQQFARDRALLDTSELDRVHGFDAERGLVTVGAGLQWPDMARALEHLQKGVAGGRRWGFRQKQTGADRLSLGGALAANAHGRGLAFPPFVADVESFQLVTPQGRVLHCSRTDNALIFQLVAGGYGLFGVVTRMTMRLMRRRKVERNVEVRQAAGLVQAFEARLRDGCLYGDFQFEVDSESPGFLQRGVFSCYRQVSDETPLPDRPRALSREQWCELLHLAHVDKGLAFQLYADHYRSTHGQIYWSDTHQLASYVDGYHDEIDRCGHPGSEMISELYVPRGHLERFLTSAANELRRRAADVIYGTVRLIERDTDSFLAWARRPWACVVLNLHVDRGAAGREVAAGHFRALIDLARELGGSYFLTYHRWATRDQVEDCHPRFRAFLDAKRRLDPAGTLWSDWYEHHLRLFGIGS
ncbi:MAG: FAD-binding oxidoreductase [Thermoanaerobaculia bacterium]|nr:FAD-binding oxidoreductase [Thermoanaerobaculia bacterium]